MAALCPGVQYGLSSQQNIGENKDVIFVKLTDSSIRAIHDYLKNQNKFSCQAPTIKFLGNEGQLSFPSLHNGSTTFSFTMSSTADMEGPGGSFECVQQTGGPSRGGGGSLECLGSIPYKVRVMANEDVYEATRHRMTIAEENHKNKCTREIKPNQTDIGRKVKLKQSRTSLPMIRRDGPPNSRESLQKPSYQSNLPSKPPVISSSNGLSNGLGSNHVSSSRPQLNKPSVPDIARRPIKERMIHLLALKPFKKVELYDRLMKESSMREKNGMTSILKQISTLKDNCYHLNRSMWSEVNEDWPFYTESERQMLKRRKPQNLTPPGGSDGGSSGSGQSPTSTHPGSPPPPISSSKRPGYFDNQDGLPTKRQRISHYRKPSEQTYRPPVENNANQRRPITDSRDASNMNPRSRESPSNNNNGYHLMPITGSGGLMGSGSSPIMATTNGLGGGNGGGGIYANGMLNDKRNCGDDGDDLGNNRKRSNCDSHSLSFNVNRDSKTLFGGSSKPPPPQISHQEDPRATRESYPLTNGNAAVAIPNGRYKLDSKQQQQQHYQVPQAPSSQQQDRAANVSKYDGTSSNRERERDRVSSTNRPARVSPDSQSDRIVEAAQAPLSPIKSKLDSTSEFPDYMTEYTTIKNGEQRRQYKADFNADYAEYKDLHGIVEKVSRRFVELELRLKQEDPSSPRYKELKRQIVREYHENKEDLEHQRSKRRFQFLHEKLSHIKRLVLEYDQGISTLDPSNHLSFN